MKKISNDKKRGFTIIEVSLVLAIAGLIFLMIFVALPALQRNSRDAQRKDDLMTYLEQLKKYQTNNRGNLPSDPDAWRDFKKNYFKGHSDPSGDTAYEQKIIPCNAAKTSDPCGNDELDSAKNSSIYSSSFPYTSVGNYTILVVTQAACGEVNGNVLPVKTSNPRTVAALYRLEGGGVYCDNI